MNNTANGPSTEIDPRQERLIRAVLRKYADVESNREVARRIGADRISYETIRRWRNGDYSGRLYGETVEALREELDRPLELPGDELDEPED